MHFADDHMRIKEGKKDTSGRYASHGRLCTLFLTGTSANHKMQKK